ncbi:hypothetical protein CLAIMM_09649 isoform 1, partial [Cladophialophora immunda]
PWRPDARLSWQLVTLRPLAHSSRRNAFAVLAVLALYMSSSGTWPPPPAMIFELLRSARHGWMTTIERTGILRTPCNAFPTPYLRALDVPPNPPCSPKEAEVSQASSVRSISEALAPQKLQQAWVTTRINKKTPCSRGGRALLARRRAGIPPCDRPANKQSGGIRLLG